MAWAKKTDPAKAPSVYWLTVLAGLGKMTIAYVEERSFFYLILS